ncbi:DUF6378 domain-containing protein [Acidovorax sp. Leaf78]|uniref:DUF6378 domain-containing protein n=1 Tax=Acidovorax sp. Leaf78 TaxID=1736237 RepID=UPI0006FE4572|nr:DUF6378 domain-containing protein [Acidovorax sp. Leaf78]KQO23472.1 hypothetical protein ASF16_04735 [Acidovorax sp. Leaf78]
MSTSSKRSRAATKPAARGTTIAKALPGHAAPVAAASNVASIRTGPKLAQEVLRDAAEIINHRGHQRDGTQGIAVTPQERSMAATVAAFNAIEDTSLTTRQGWAFMQTLKLTRAAASARNGVFHADDYTDGAAYAALGHEAAEDEAAHAVS